MINRIAILSAVLMIPLLASAQVKLTNGNKAENEWVLKGTCKGSIDESDGVQIQGKELREFVTHPPPGLTIGNVVGPGFGAIWSTQPINCDSVTLVQMDDYKGHTMLLFSNGDPTKPILGLAGTRFAPRARANTSPANRAENQPVATMGCVVESVGSQYRKWQ